MLDEKASHIAPNYKSILNLIASIYLFIMKTKMEYDTDPNLGIIYI